MKSVLALRRRYDRAVRLITEAQSPYSDTLKVQLQKEHALLSEVQGGERTPHGEILFKVGKYNFGIRGASVHLIDKNVTKQESKQPIWQDFQRLLFARLRQKGTTKTQSARLIGRLLTTLTPSWFPVGYPADAVRLTVKRPPRQTPPPVEKSEEKPVISAAPTKETLLDLKTSEGQKTVKVIGYGDTGVRVEHWDGQIQDLPYHRIADAVETGKLPVKRLR
ncbi:MAG: hypothetical protein AB7G75_26265 [Candidatus Binatia bacterium]